MDDDEWREPRVVWREPRLVVDGIQYTRVGTSVAVVRNLFSIYPDGEIGERSRMRHDWPPTDAELDRWVREGLISIWKQGEARHGQ